MNFSNQNIDEIIFTIFNGIEGASPDVIISAILQSILPFVIIFLLFYLPTTKLGKKVQKKKYILDLFIRKKKFSINIHPFFIFSRYKFSYAIFSLILSSILCFHILDINQYISRLTEFSTIFEDYYIDGKDVNIEFPEEKRNLIILYLESMENTMMDEESGGAWDYDVIPELTSLAKNYINFSHHDKIGGPKQIPGTQWTVAGLVSSSSGIPLKIPIDGNSYTSSEEFLPGAYSLGDIFSNEGYNLGLMFGSDADYGGRSNYYLSHGNYEIFDVKRAIEEDRMTEEEKVWWGFDDSDLFEWAKEEITNYANLEEPFSFTFLTANTHFPDGYLESDAENKFNSQYENVHAHSSKQVEEFVQWLQQQEFYDNTTLVIIGDHLSMQPTEYYTARISETYTRTMYNAFINTAIQPVNPKNRIFTSLDMYPTILASIGVEIEGDRLGLGTNLFSDKLTIPEELGFDYFVREIGKNSHFYNQNILQDDYLKLLENATE